LLPLLHAGSPGRATGNRDGARLTRICRRGHGPPAPILQRRFIRPGLDSENGT